MADIVYRKKGPAAQLIVNGVDLSMDTFQGVELVEVGDDPEYAEVGLRITIAVSRLDLDTTEDVQITDNFPAVAQMVRSVAKATEAETA